MSTKYTDENIFKEQNIVSRYEEFVVEGLENVSQNFDGLFKWVNEKILFPQLLSKKDDIPIISIIDFGIGSGKFTIPYIKTLRSLELHIQVLGFDNSNYMLRRFVENAKNGLNVSLEKENNDYFFNNNDGLIRQIALYNKDLNNYDEIAAKIKAFGERGKATLVSFAQVWHYLKKPKEFLQKVINPLKNIYILHYEPIYYFKLLDGNFDQTDTSLDFSSVKSQLHRRFWCFYFYLRDQKRPYSTQKIKGARIDECFKLYEENKFTKIGEHKIPPWKKQLDFDNLLELIEIPIFSGQYVGLYDNKRKQFAKEIKDSFKDKINDFSGEVDFGYIGHLFSTRKINEKYPLLINIGSMHNENRKATNSEEILLSLKQKFPECKFIGIPLVFINRFSSLERFETIEFTNLEPWKEYIEELKSRGTPSIAEVVTKEKMEKLHIKNLMQEPKIEFNDLNQQAKTNIYNSLKILKDKALDQFHLIKKGEKIDLFCFPLFTTDRIEETFTNIVATFIMGEEEDEKLNEIKQTIQKEWQNLPEMKEIFSRIRKEFQENATRSAISAIMSRNMSHNIGSHILINLEKDKEKDGVNDKDIKYFLSYLRARMDFLAQVATDWPSWSLPTRFLQDLIFGFFNQLCLLRFIGDSEGLNENKLRFNIIVNGQKFEWLRDPSKGVEQLREKLSKYDRYVSILGGITGRQAFYVILENIIRNAAKHSYKDKESNLEITIKLTENTNDYSLEIWDNVSTGAGLESEMNEKIQKPIIKSTGEIERGNWGIAEMKISSAYLQKKNPLDFADPGKENFQILGADNEKGFLKYELKLLKPKEVGIWDFSGELKSTHEQEKESVTINEMSLEDLKNHNFDADYEFLMIYPGSKQNNIELLKNMLEEKTLEMLPYRLFFVGDKPENSLPPYAEKRIVFLKPEKSEKENTKAPFLAIFNVIRSSKDDASRSQIADDDIQNFKLGLYVTWIKHLRDKIRGDEVTGKKVHLYLNLKAKKQNEESRQYYSTYLKDHYLYLKPVGIDNSESVAKTTDNAWSDLHGVIAADPILSDIIASVSFEKKNNWTNDGVLIAYPRHGEVSVPSGIKIEYSTNYLEDLSGASPHFSLLASPPTDPYQLKKLTLWLVENGMLRLAIADERLVEALWKEKEKLKDRSKICLISAIRKDGEKELVVKKDEYWCELKMEDETKITLSGSDDCQVDALIIHQGILDKVIKRGFCGSKGQVEDWITNLKTQIPFIVVTSGRGKPDKVPDNSKFVPFSDIQHAFSSGASSHGKMILTYVLMNSKNSET